MASSVDRLIRAALAGLAGLLVVAWDAPARASVDPLVIERARSDIAAGDVAAGFALVNDAIGDARTTDRERIDLLGELARLHSARREHKDAADALTLQAELIARLDGARTPKLAALYMAAADAHLQAGDAAAALPLARDALAVDAAYYDCSTDVIARDHGRLADLLERLGKADEAAEERRLATAAPALRCVGERSGVDTSPTVVTNDISGRDEDKFARVKLFYATDRARSGSDRPDDFYGGDRGDMEYGTVEVTVPRIHKPGAIESPSLLKLEWGANPERHFVITRLATTSEDGLFADIKSTLTKQKSDEALVFIHGFNNTFADGAKRAAQMTYDLNFEGAPILFSWPSQGSTFSYVRDEAVVRLSGRHLLHFLDDLVAHSGAGKINLVAHSMGNRALLDALELMAVRRQGAGETGPVFDEVIFAAPDEDAALFSTMLSEIRPLARRLTLYGSNRDLALDVSRRVHGDLPRAGQAGDGIVVSKALDSIDMTVLGDDMLAHSYFAGTGSALTDMLLLLWRDSSPGDRCGMNAETRPAGRAWLFDPARCNGAAMLSALTLLKEKGSAALGVIDTIIASSAGNAAEDNSLKEWQQVRDALASLIAVPH